MPSVDGLPVDINYAKIADWLVDRRKLAGDWRKRLQAVQSSALAACREGLSGKLQAQLLAGSSDSAAGVSYLAALHLRDQLAVSADKTLLGYYKGEAGIVDKIVKVFEKGSLQLGAIGQTLVRNVKYEVPYYQQQAGKQQQQLMDLEKRQTDLLRQAATAAASFRQEIEQMGIRGQDIPIELRQLPQQLPTLLQPLVDLLQSQPMAISIGTSIMAGVEVLEDDRCTSRFVGEAGLGKAWAWKAGEGPGARLAEDASLRVRSWMTSKSCKPSSARRSAEPPPAPAPLASRCSWPARQRVSRGKPSFAGSQGRLQIGTQLYKNTGGRSTQARLNASMRYRELKDLAEQQISSILDGHTVHIIGEINTLI
ncbi:hypothetical protein WJX84_000769 [Apatococcus fuscideae]|uniref:Uncharacterized protein n=1 Tax=Apatococcus fuscideae TaxID=2026836 RepID=A0AAW1TBR9_9CHLO